MNRVVRVITVLSSLLVLSCASREHMSENYGKQSRTFFARQHVHTAATTGSPAGLDSEEAALIQTSYRQTLGAPSAPTPSTNSSRVLLLEEAKDGKPSK